MKEGGSRGEWLSEDWVPMTFPVVQCCFLAFKGRLYWHQTSGKWIWPKRKKATHLSRWYGKECRADAGHLCVICVLEHKQDPSSKRQEQAFLTLKMSLFLVLHSKILFIWSFQFIKSQQKNEKTKFMRLWLFASKRWKDKNPCKIRFYIHVDICCG